MRPVRIELTFPRLKVWCKANICYDLDGGLKGGMRRESNPQRRPIPNSITSYYLGAEAGLARNLSGPLWQRAQQGSRTHIRFKFNFAHFITQSEAGNCTRNLNVMSVAAYYLPTSLYIY